MLRADQADRLLQDEIQNPIQPQAGSQREVDNV